MIIRIPKKRLIEFLTYCLFFLLPFTFFINKLIFKDAHFMGVGVLNVLYDFIIILVAITSILNPKKYSNITHIWILYVVFIILNLFKMFFQENGMNSFISALPLRLYYFLLPLVWIMLKNKNLNLHVIANNLIKSTIIICPISIYMFLTSNYFGMVDYEQFLIYGIVGTPFARMFSIFGSPLVAGTFFMIVLLIMLYERNLKKIGNKIIFLLNFLCLLLTFSRTAFITFFIVVVFKYFYNKEFALWQKIMACIFMFILFIGIIVFSANNGIYFWNIQDLFYNIRYSKWAAGLSEIQNNLFFGTEFTLHISSSNTFAATLSDNSFLLFLGYYGLLMIFFVMFTWIVTYFQKNLYTRKYLKPVIVCGFVLCFFYDFVQFFPSNYLLVFLYIYLEKKAELYNKQNLSK